MQAKRMGLKTSRTKRQGHEAGGSAAAACPKPREESQHCLPPPAPAAPERADLQGRLQRLICLLRHQAGGRCQERAELRLSPRAPPGTSGSGLVIQLPPVRSPGLLLGAHRGAAVGTPAQQGYGPSSEQDDTPSNNSIPSGMLGRRSPNHGQPRGVPLATQCSGGSVQLCTHLARSDVHGVCAHAPGAEEHPAHFPTPIHQAGSVLGMRTPN